MAMTTLEAGLIRSEEAAVRPSRPLLAALWRRWSTPVLFLLPAALFLSIWIYWPLYKTFQLSFYEWNLLPTQPPNFVGLANYIRLLELPDLRKAAVNTLFYTFGLLPLTVGLPFAIALWTRRAGGRAGAIYRGLIFVPMLIAPVVVAIVWRWLLDPDHGVIDQVLLALHVTPVRFLQDRTTALLTILFITGWKLMGFSALIYAAAITNIDKHLIESAKLDGAHEGRIIMDVIVPLVSPVTLFLSMLTLLHGAQWSFIYINVLTQGGPLQSTTNLYYLLWDYGFGNFAIGWATAAGMILFVVFGIIAFFCLKIMNRFAFYEN